MSFSAACDAGVLWVHLCQRCVGAATVTQQASAQALGSCWEDVLVPAFSAGTLNSSACMLLQVGYPCLSLHGAKDQSDRESTINDFKTGVSQVGPA